MGWITCEWADDFMTPTWLKRHCVVLVAPLTLVFLSLAVVGLFLHRSFMVKEAPLHLQVFCESSTSNLWFGQLYISFWAHYFMLKDRIGTLIRFHRSSNDYESCWENETCNFDCQYSHLEEKKQSEQLQKITGKFEKLNGWMRNVLVSISFISFLCTVGRT